MFPAKMGLAKYPERRSFLVDRMVNSDGVDRRDCTRKGLCTDFLL
jgi:hypothetical protein